MVWFQVSYKNALYKCTVIMVDTQSTAAEIRRGIKKEEEDRKK